MSSDSGRLHTGHRARMRSRFSETGLSGFQPHEIMELILYCAIPKRDVNPLAHAIIDHFGSLDKALSASREELLAVPGVGPKTSDLIVAFNQLGEDYRVNRFANWRTFPTVVDAAEYVLGILPYKYKQQMIILFEDHSGAFLTAQYYPNRPGDPGIIRAVADDALTISAHSMVIFSTSFGPLRAPHPVEFRAVSDLIQTLDQLNVYTVDYVYLIGSHLYSLRERNVLSQGSADKRVGIPRWNDWLYPLRREDDAPGWYLLDSPTYE